MGDIIDFRSRKKYPEDAETSLIMNRLSNLQNALRDVYKHIEDGWESISLNYGDSVLLEFSVDTKFNGVWSIYDVGEGIFFLTKGKCDLDINLCNLSLSSGMTTII